ncbi:hypothetical protein AHMF7605_11645 [Adhaeribacter arboris]|uniref:PAS domain-containing protein n=1 Tax=Adhaeribacter arboris TaxID=2072846 RepID=A0A2T2YF34_9BACT|nr:PAS domain S-box protein [Adhaeribacter arboris]PSR54125.1 hypothetical protein AHMF7605_11645 [Adhaeribacter arboris]
MDMYPLQPLFFWLILPGVLMLVMGTGVLLFNIYRLFRKRRDIQRFPLVIVCVVLFISTPLITNTETLASIFFPNLYLKSGVIFMRGLVTAISAFVLHYLYPRLLRIPTREEIEEEISLFKAMEAISLEGHIRTEDGKMVSANQKACKIYGYTEAELLNLDVKELIWPEDYERIMQLRGQNYREKYECLGKHKDGSKLYLEVRGRMCATRASKYASPPLKI